jgi:hypothetical protein
MQTRLALFAVTLGLAACQPDDPSAPAGDGSPDHRLRFSAMDTTTRTRLVRAVMQDAEIARFVATQVRFHAPPCATADVDQADGGLTLTGAMCNTGAGSSFQGKLTFLGPDVTSPRLRFDHVQVTGEARDDTILIDGSVESELDPTTQRLTETIDLELSRGFLRVHTTALVEDGQVVDGATIDLDGKRATLGGNLRTGFTLTGADTYTFSPEGDCGLATLGDGHEQVCLYSPTPSRFTLGAFRQLTATCTGSDGQLALESTSDLPMRGSIGGVQIDLGASTRTPDGTFVFTIPDSSCAGLEQRSYSVLQAGGTTSSYRAELMAIPRVTWGTSN